MAGMALWDASKSCFRCFWGQINQTRNSIFFMFFFNKREIPLENIFHNPKWWKKFHFFSLCSLSNKKFFPLLSWFFHPENVFHKSLSFFNSQMEQRTLRAKRCRTITWWEWIINHSNNWHRWCRHRSFWIQLIAYTRCRTNISAMKVRKTFTIRTTKCASKSVLSNVKIILKFSTKIPLCIKSVQLKSCEILCKAKMEIKTS